MSEPLPAHLTKHARVLAHPHPALTEVLYLSQSDDGRTNGTALWLAAQVLSLYLVSRPPLPAPCHRRPRAVELGSGVGLMALVLAALGYDVLATDTPLVCDAVLRHNIAANLPQLPSSAGSIQVRELDWNVESERWIWNDPVRITPDGDASNARGADAEDLLGPPFDLIMSSDTLYDVSLVQPFFRTVRALAASSHAIEPLRPPLFLLALERRDPCFMDDALACAPVPLTQVPTKKIRKALERAGIRWDRSDWEDVEIWRGSLQVQRSCYQ